MKAESCCSCSRSPFPRLFSSFKITTAPLSTIIVLVFSIQLHSTSAVPRARRLAPTTRAQVITDLFLLALLPSLTAAPLYAASVPGFAARIPGLRPLEANEAGRFWDAGLVGLETTVNGFLRVSCFCVCVCFRDISRKVDVRPK